MAVSVIATNYGLDKTLVSDTLLIRLVKLGVPVLVGVVIYAVMVVILRVDAVKGIVDTVKRKLGAGKTQNLQ